MHIGNYLVATHEPLHVLMSLVHLLKEGDQKQGPKPFARLTMRGKTVGLAEGKSGMTKKESQYAKKLHMYQAVLNIGPVNSLGSPSSCSI